MPVPQPVLPLALVPRAVGAAPQRVSVESAVPPLAVADLPIRAALHAAPVGLVVVEPALEHSAVRALPHPTPCATEFKLGESFERAAQHEVGRTAERERPEPAIPRTVVLVQLPLPLIAVSGRRGQRAISVKLPAVKGPHVGGPARPAPHALALDLWLPPWAIILGRQGWGSLQHTPVDKFPVIAPAVAECEDATPCRGRETMKPGQTRCPACPAPRKHCAHRAARPA